MKLSVDVNARVQVLLRPFAQLFVLFKNLFVELAQVVELLVRGILVAIHFILDPARRRRDRYHPLYAKEVLPATSRQ